MLVDDYLGSHLYLLLRGAIGMHATPQGHSLLTALADTSNLVRPMWCVGLLTFLPSLCSYSVVVQRMFAEAYLGRLFIFIPCP